MGDVFMRVSRSVQTEIRHLFNSYSFAQNWYTGWFAVSAADDPY